jgi:hypothetical protein
MRKAPVSLLVVALLGGGPVAGQVILTNDGDAAGLTVIHTPDIEGIPGVQEWMTGGMAIGDFNNDGHPDVYWVSGGGIFDRLFINQGDGTFVNEAIAWGLTDFHCGNGAAVGDYNNDGLLDIYVTSFGGEGVPAMGSHRLYRNDGGSFTEVGEAAGVNQTCTTQSGNPAGYGAAWGDYDLDGDLDLAVSSWWEDDDGNRLFMNNGDGTFSDVTEEALGAAIDEVWGFQPAFVDMDGDRYPELLLAADFDDSKYFVNNADGTFTDATGPSGTGIDDNGMGQAVGDFDNDTLFDWYVTSIHDETPEEGDDEGNMLYMSQGDHVYVENSVDAGCNDGGWGWGALPVDLDHDGWLDIMAVNGRNAKGSQWINERGKLFHNTRNGIFTEIAEAAGFDHTDEGRGMAYLDADGDGDLDILVSTFEGPLTYYRNDTDPIGNWITITLDTSTNPLLAPNGFGTRVIATLGAESFHRYMSGSPSYLATSELIIHFGLGKHASVDELRFEWSRGYVTVLNDVPANQHLIVAAPKLGDIDGSGAVSTADLLALIGAWGPCPQPPAPCLADLDGDGQVATTDLLILLGAWGS